MNVGSFSDFIFGKIKWTQQITESLDLDYSTTRLLDNKIERHAFNHVGTGGTGGQASIVDLLEIVSMKIEDGTLGDPWTGATIGRGVQASHGDWYTKIEALVTGIFCERCTRGCNQITAGFAGRATGSIGTGCALSHAFVPFTGGGEPDQDGFSIDGGMDVRGGDALETIKLNESGERLIGRDLVFTDTILGNGTVQHSILTIDRYRSFFKKLFRENKFSTTPFV